MQFRVVRDKLIMGRFQLIDDAKAYARELSRRSGANSRVWFVNDATGKVEEQ